ncbi:MBF2 family protein [Streptomyces tsukubensis]|uniref:MBF2 family protein n=1 Tax=Streptomyces tsukubensis TaxID=83656 RepID=UPI00344BF33D
MTTSRNARRGAWITAAAVLALVVTGPTVSVARAEPSSGAPASTLFGQPAAECPPLSPSHNLFVGFRLPGDRLVVTEPVVKDAVPGRIVLVEQTFSVPSPQRITLLEAVDQVCDGTGASVSILQGGPGSGSVTLRFKSERGQGINFVVQLYAR